MRILGYIKFIQVKSKGRIIMKISTEIITRGIMTIENKTTPEEVACLQVNINRGMLLTDIRLNSENKIEVVLESKEPGDVNI